MLALCLGLILAVMQAEPPCQVVARIERVHCKRGPLVCDKCRAVAGQAWYLLNTCPPNKGEVARRVLHVPHQGHDFYLEFDIIRGFDDEAAARSYAAEHKLVVVIEN